jgi:hypothetical protein
LINSTTPAGTEAARTLETESTDTPWPAQEARATRKNMMLAFERLEAFAVNTTDYQSPCPLDSEKAAVKTSMWISVLHHRDIQTERRQRGMTV